jgi:dTDP-glucose pyrophosphorylase
MKQITDVAPYLCPAAATIRAAMARINATAELFQLVVDDAGRMLGTVTDGDIRRALLRGHGLDEPVAACMNVDALAGAAGDDAGNLRLLGRGRGLIPFLPVCDADGRVAAILVAAAGARSLGTALVMAGGFGQRLGAMTREVPKPLLPVGDRPILSRLLARLEDTGFDSILLSVHFRADKFRAFLDDYDGRADIRLIVEDRPFGTAGAIRLMPERPAEPFLIVNADVLTEVDFAAMRAFHERHDNDATVATAQYEHAVPYGVVRHTDDGLLQSIEEKPVVRYNVAAGIYYLSPEFCDLVPDAEAIDMPALLMRGRESGLRVGLFPVHEYWRDIGRPADLEAANHENQAMAGAAGQGRQR